MQELDPAAYERLVSLCGGLEHHAAVGALIAGAARGTAHVDDPRRPRSALVRVKHRFFLAGAADNAAFNARVQSWFEARVYPDALREGVVEWVLYYDGDHWEPAIETMMAGRYPIRDLREYYRLVTPRRDWRGLVPEGMAVRPVDRSLLEEVGLARLDDLREEMCSERSSVEEFLAHSTGTCIVRRGGEEGEALVSWCLSEYDHGERCEIGIETVQRYRRRGLATIAASALVERLVERGMARIGWHCWRSNVASGATARKAGFERMAEYPVYFAWFDAAANLAVNGNIRLRDGDHAAALAWFQRSLATGRAPSWAYVGAARAAAALGRAEEALSYLEVAVDRGFTHTNAIRGAEELGALHDSEGWRRLMARLDGGGAAGR